MPCRRKIAEQVVVARVVDQRGVAGLEQIAGHEFKRVASALRQQDLACAGGDAKLGQHECQMLAQWEITEMVPVFEQIRAVLAREHIEAPADAGFVEPRIRQPRAASKDSVLVGLQ
jgi:hypothetical protein